MTTDPLSEIRAREAAATPGPWERDAYYVVGPIPGGRPGGEAIVQCQPTVSAHRNAPWNYSNAAFIAHARTDIPFLLAEIDRLRAEVEAERERCAKVAEEAFIQSDGGPNDQWFKGNNSASKAIASAIRTLAPRLADDGGGK